MFATRTYAEAAANRPKIRTANGVWQVEVITDRTGQQSFRVKRLDTVMPVSSGWTPTGQLVATTSTEVLGPAVP